jgi:hypothetical protein
MIEPRQIDDLITTSTLLSEIKPAKIENLAPIHAKRPGAKRVKIYYGPFTLLGGNARHFLATI